MVHSKKHYTQHSISTVTGGTATTVNIVSSVAVEDIAFPIDVTEGSTIKAVYCEYWVRAGEVTGATGQAVIYKTQADEAAPSTTEMAALHNWVNKRNILYTTMGLFNDQDADAIAIHKGWLKIPKGKQRFALGDKLRMTIFSPTIDLHLCGFSTYKEYT